MGLLRKYAKYLSRGSIYEELEAFCADIPPDATVLNIGAGGSFEAMLKKFAPASASIISSDIDPDRAPDVVDDITSSQFDDQTFDRVVCLEVLEHVKLPRQAVDEIERILKVDGAFIVSTPFIFPTHDAPYDFYRYTEFGLRDLFSRMTIESIVARTSYVETIVLLALRGMWIFKGFGKLVGVLTICCLSPLLLLEKLSQGKMKSRAFTAGFVLHGRRASTVPLFEAA